MPERIVITGASRGIGRATAYAFADAKTHLHLVGRPSEQLEQTAAECTRRGALTHQHACDLAQPEQIIATFDRLVDQHGAPSVVINNAGVLPPEATIENAKLGDWQHTMAVNLTAPFLVSQRLLPAMRAEGRGRFIHVASISSTLGCPGRAGYGASKWGLLGLHKALHEELRGSGLISVALCPGSVDTEMLKQTSFTPDMTPEDVASLIRYYALEAPAAVAGATVEIHG